MKTKRNFETLDEMLFENRNKEYGAYFLRKNYNRHLSKALLIGVAPLLLFFLSSFIIARNTVKKIKPTIDTSQRIINWPENPPTLPKPPKEESNLPIKKVKVKTMVIPTEVTPVEDIKSIVAVDIPTDDELENVAIGIKNQEGKAAEGSFNLPSEIEQKGVFEKASEPPVKPEIDKTFITSEVMPEFEGGIQKMYKWLGKNLKYPLLASNHGIEGRVIVTFVVEKDGGISNVEILKGVGFGCNEEAERVIKAMPKWKAGLQNGKPVRVRYTIPLNFQITH
jgi:periplasmic protein TonB